jgi:hypothetical protein
MEGTSENTSEYIAELAANPYDLASAYAGIALHASIAERVADSGTTFLETLGDGQFDISTQDKRIATLGVKQAAEFHREQAKRYTAAATALGTVIESFADQPLQAAKEVSVESMLDQPKAAESSADKPPSILREVISPTHGQKINVISTDALASLHPDHPPLATKLMAVLQRMHIYSDERFKDSFVVSADIQKQVESKQQAFLIAEGLEIMLVESWYLLAMPNFGAGMLELLRKAYDHSMQEKVQFIEAGESQRTF